MVFYQLRIQGGLQWWPDVFVLVVLVLPLSVVAGAGKVFGL